MAQSKGLPFVVTLNEKEGLPQSTDQKKEIEEEISKAVVYVYAFEVVLFEKLWTRWSIRPTFERHDTVVWPIFFSSSTYNSGEF